MVVVSLQSPPDEYNRAYFEELVRALAWQFTQNAIPQVFVCGKLIFVPPAERGIPTSGYGQPVGTVYVDEDILRMVVANHGYPAPLTITSALGTVTAVGT